MDIKEEEILSELVSDHWYYRSKSDAIIRYIGDFLPKQVLDVGAGSGFFSKQLLKQTNTQKVLCVDINYNTDKDEIFVGKKIQFCKRYDSADVDLVLLMDVLEHVDDDIGFIKEQISKVPPGTRFLITVPAFTFLWSKHDDFLEHKRRYTLQQLECLLSASGLVVERGSYFFALIFPFVAIVRLLGKLRKSIDNVPKSDLKQHCKITNLVLESICKLELQFFLKNRCAGLSVFCLARKPGAN